MSLFVIFFPMTTSALLFLQSRRKLMNSPPQQDYRHHPFTTSASLLLLLAGDIHANPGPRQLKFPCLICSKACKWVTPCVRCDSCHGWYHQECMLMSTMVFSALKNITWECTQCGLPNFSSSLFNTTICDDSNPFDPLSPSQNNIPELDLSFNAPDATSSPKRPLDRYEPEDTPNKSRLEKPMRTVVVNCQSVTNKKPHLENLIDTTQADIIIGTESHINPEIGSNEVFPEGYKAYRKDRLTTREGAHTRGGVFILVSTKYESTEPDELHTNSPCELLWVKVKVKGHPTERPICRLPL